MRARLGVTHSPTPVNNPRRNYAEWEMGAKGVWVPKGSVLALLHPFSRSTAHCRQIDTKMPRGSEVRKRGRERQTRQDPFHYGRKKPLQLAEVTSLWFIAYVFRNFSSLRH